MRPEQEPRPLRTRAVPDPHAEQEVDFAGYGRSVLERWWLVLAAVVVGALIGYLLSSSGGSDVNRAEATIYLGQPLSANSTTQVPTVSTSPPAVREITRSDELVEQVAAEVGIEPVPLRNGIATSQVGGSVARQGLEDAIFEVSVQGPWARETVAEAANLLAAEVVERTSGYVDTKIAAYERRLESLNGELEGIDRRTEQLERAAADADLTPVERLTMTSLIGFAEERRTRIIDEITSTELLLLQATDVEKGQVVTEARASSITPRSDRSSTIVGGILGLLAGLALALASEPLQRRRQLRAS